MYRPNELKFFRSSASPIKNIIYLNYLLLHINLTNGAPSTLPSLTELNPTLNGKYAANSLMSINNGYTNLTRQYEGDIFSANDVTKCSPDTCIGLSSGTASLLTPEFNKTDMSMVSINDNNEAEGCTCRCHSYLKTYREDLGICVDDVRECTLSPFISGSSSEKIPFVFLPLRGQIIYPSREIKFSDITIPICAVTGSQYLTSNGWADLRNPIDTDLPFRMFRDEGRTFLQWLGEPELRNKMQGRLVLIHLMCRDMSLSNNKTATYNDSSLNTHNIYTPCVAFRINGSPVKFIHNVSEVSFQSEASLNLSAATDGLSTREYIVIAVCSLLLGLIYVSSVFLYLHVKKRKSINCEPEHNSIDDLDNNINYPKNDQVTFGIPFTRAGSSYSLDNMNDHRNSERSHSRNINSPGSTLKDDMGVVKNNPLLKHFPSLSDNSGFASDLSNSNSEFDDNLSNKNEKSNVNQTSAVVHPSSANSKIQIDANLTQESSPSPTQDFERLPEANVSIIEEFGSEEKQLENMRALVNGTVRKKLYFNPAYFEPHLLLSPPPAAIEFLTKIREVIAIAKYKMASKRYQPTLGAIHEEIRSEFSEGSRLNCSLKEELYTLHKSDALQHEQHAVVAENEKPDEITKLSYSVGDKTNSIQKWLETVSPPHEASVNLLGQNENIDVSKPTLINIRQNLPMDTISSEIKQTKDFDRGGITNHNTCEVKSALISEVSPNIGSSMMGKENIMGISKISSEINKYQDTSMKPALKGYFSDIGSVQQYADTQIEIYNNPKFSHTDSPQPSTKSRSTRNKLSKKRIEILDQYSNPQKPEASHYELMKNIKQMPDMVYEAIAKDYSMAVYNNSSSSRPNSQTFNIPTPDYDQTLEKKLKASCRSLDDTIRGPSSLSNFEYSVLAKRGNARCYQPPDSPIYRRKSPQYLIVDYETDSLERNTHQNRKCTNSSSPTSNNSSEVSSQPSPSLSTALPLEEEVEIRHTVYDKVEGFRKDGDMHVKGNKSKMSDYEVLHRKIEKKNLSPMIRYDTPFRGSMTIEVQHEPLSDFEPSTDSDQFEPDTLDRKPKKHSFGDIKNDDAWSEHLKKSKKFVNSCEEKISYSSLENMTSLPDFSIEQDKNNNMKNCLVLKSSSSFRSNMETMNKRTNSHYDEMHSSKLEYKPLFGSLREIYQSKASRNLYQRPKLTNIDFLSEQGRLLTLEAKHTKRQRQIEGKDKNIKVLPPDVVPKTVASYATIDCAGEKSKQKNDVKESFNSSAIDNESIDKKLMIEKQSSSNIKRKNFQGWNIDNFSGNHNENSLDCSKHIKLNNSEMKYDVEAHSHDETDETISNHSESTEITGVSDTQANSEFEDEGTFQTKLQQPNAKGKRNNKIKHRFFANLSITNDDSWKSNKSKTDSNIGEKSAIKIDSPLNSPIAIRKKNVDLSGDFSYERYLNRKKKLDEEQNGNFRSKSILLNNNTETNSFPIASNQCLKELSNADQKLNVKQVYRVEIESQGNGMQIALGIKDRSKKSKDIKNAWKRFICLATAKLSSNSVSDIDLSLKKRKTAAAVGCLEDCLAKNISIQAQNEQKLQKINKQILNSNNCSVQLKHELDSGYMSGDSSEMLTKRYYERFNYHKTPSNLESTPRDLVNKLSTENLEDAQKSSKNFEDATEGSQNSLKTLNELNHHTQNTEYDHYFDSSCITFDHMALNASESDDGGNTEDLSESGAESVETHSVFFKNIRKPPK